MKSRRAMFAIVLVAVVVFAGAAAAQDIQTSVLKADVDGTRSRGGVAFLQVR